MGSIHDEVVRAGHSVEYFCAEDVNNSKFATGRFGRFGFPVAVVNHVRSLAKQGKPIDIVNVHEPAGSGLVLSRSILNGVKVVVTSHGLEERSWKLRLDPEAFPGEKPSLKTKIIHPTTVLWQARLALRRADHIFCLNEEDRDYIVGNFGRNEREITRIFPAADPVFGRSAETRDYRQAQKLLFAGTWLSRKGIHYMAEAFRGLVKKHPLLELVALNPGVPESQVKQLFPSEIQNNVRCLVTKQEQETVRAFEDAHIFVLPSLFEGTPLTLLEAMWSGLPIVTTATCGMKDVVENGRNGLLIPPRSSQALEEAIVKLIDQESLRRSLGQAAWREASGTLRWQDSARRVLAGYEQALGADTVTDLQKVNH